MGFCLYLDPCEVWAQSLPVGGLLARLVRAHSESALRVIIKITAHDQFHKPLSNHPQQKPKNTRDVEHYHAQHPVSH